MFPGGRIPSRFQQRNIMYYMNIGSFKNPNSVLAVIEAVFGGGEITDAIAASFARMNAQDIRDRVREVMLSASTPQLVIQRLRQTFDRAQRAK